MISSREFQVRWLLLFTRSQAQTSSDIIIQHEDEGREKQGQGPSADGRAANKTGQLRTNDINVSKNDPYPAGKEGPTAVILDRRFVGEASHLRSWA